MPIYAYTFNSTDNTTKTTMTMGTPVSPLTCSSTEADCATTKNKLGVCNNFASTVWYTSPPPLTWICLSMSGTPVLLWR